MNILTIIGIILFFTGMLFESTIGILLYCIGCFLIIKRLLTPIIIHEIKEFFGALFSILLGILIVLCFICIIVFAAFSWYISAFILGLLIIIIAIKGCITNYEYDEELRNRETDYNKNIDILRKECKKKYGKKYFRTKKYKREKESLDFHKKQLNETVQYYEFLANDKDFQKRLEEEKNKGRLFK